jgi:hypothetical protein
MLGCSCQATPQCRCFRHCWLEKEVNRTKLLLDAEISKHERKGVFKLRQTDKKAQLVSQQCRTWTFFFFFSERRQSCCIVSRQVFENRWISHSSWSCKLVSVFVKNEEVTLLYICHQHWVLFIFCLISEIQCSFFLGGEAHLNEWALNIFGIADG